jgi:hypothetical protein
VIGKEMKRRRRGGEEGKGEEGRAVGGGRGYPDQSQTSRLDGDGDERVLLSFSERGKERRERNCKELR